MPQHDDPQHEDLRERYRELLEELRTLLPGVQVLFAFLLMVPFNSRFGDVDALGRALYMVAMLAVAMSAVVFLTPVALHRAMPRSRRRDRIVLGARFEVVGMILLATSMTAAVVLVVRFIYQNDVLGWGLGLLVATAASLLWFALPLVRRLSPDD